MGDTDRCPWDMGTFGSLTTRMFGPALRAAGRRGARGPAAARLRAAGRAEGPARRRERRRVGEGRAGAQGQLRRSSRRARRSRARWTRRRCCGPVAEFTVMGRSPRRLDAVRQGHGRRRSTPATSACPACSTRGSCARPPTGRRSPRVDTSAAAQGGRASRSSNQDGLVAVLHADPEVAEAALGRVKAEWNAAPPGADTGRDLRRPPEQGAGAGGEGAEGRRGRGARRGDAPLRAAPTRRATSRTRRSSRTRRPPRSRRASSRSGPRRRRRSRRTTGSRRSSASTRRASGSSPRTSAAASAARAPAARPRRRRASRRSPASRCRWPSPAPRSSSTTRSTRPRS